MMELKARFEDAAKRAKQLPNQSNETLLKLYSLFKQGNEGDVSGDRPSMFDIRGRAKHDAWAELKGMSKEDAMRKYIELVDELASD